MVYERNMVCKCDILCEFVMVCAFVMVCMLSFAIRPSLTNQCGVSFGCEACRATDYFCAGYHTVFREKGERKNERINMSRQDEQR